MFSSTLLGLFTLVERLLATAYVVAMLHTLSPVSDAAVQRFPIQLETEQERAARYVDIATDLTGIVWSEEPLPGLSRLETARLMVAVAYHESRFSKDVDVGPCWRGPGSEGRCGGGATICMMQVDRHIYGLEEGNRPACFAVGLYAMRRSFYACREPEQRLNEYASGSCSKGTSNTRMKLATASRLAHVDFLAVDPVVR